MTDDLRSVPTEFFASEAVDDRPAQGLRIISWNLLRLVGAGVEDVARLLGGIVGLRDLALDADQPVAGLVGVEQRGADGAAVACGGTDRRFSAGRNWIARKDKSLTQAFEAYEAGNYAEARTKFEEGWKKLGYEEAAMMLGRIHPDRYPRVFGPAGDEPLDVDVVRKGFEARAAEISAATGDTRGPEQVAAGYLRIAVANPAPASAAPGAGGNRHAQRSIGHRLAYAFGPEARMTTCADAGYYRVELRLPIPKGEAAE